MHLALLSTLQFSGSLLFSYSTVARFLKGLVQVYPTVRGEPPPPLDLSFVLMGLIF